MGSLVRWGQCGYCSPAAIVLDAHVHHRRQVAIQRDVGREVESVRGVDTAERLAKHRIERGVPGAKAVVHDRADLDAPGVFGKIAALIAELHGQARADGTVPPLGRANSRPHVTADEAPRLTRSGAGESVYAHLEPRVESTSDLNCLVQLVVRGEHTGLEHSASPRR